MRTVYGWAKYLFLTGQIDMRDMALQASLMTDYVFDPGDLVIDDIGTVVATADVTVTEVTTAGIVLCGDVTFADVTGTDAINGVVIHMAELPGALISYSDQRADTVPISITPNGGDITLSYNYLVKL